MPKTEDDIKPVTEELETISVDDEAPKSAQTLDDVLMAMDIVDTLRHREQLVLRELDADSREEDLIERLREIYSAQGIEVSDEKLRDGVKALEENRFVYTPPARNWQTKLAEIYIARDKWFKPVAGAFAALIIASGVWHFGVSEPTKAKAQFAQQELTEKLPARLDELRSEIQASTENDRVKRATETYYQDGMLAVQNGNKADVTRAISSLELLQDDLNAEYTVRIVSRPGEYSGLFRIPDDAPQRPNYYLIVEAIDGAGRILTVPISSIETQSAKRVNIWGVRVPKPVFDKVSQDKKDDAIIQFSEIGTKTKGEIAPEYSIDTLDGTIFNW